MKNRHIGFGLFLLAIGLIWLLLSFNLISLPAVVNSFIVLWPLIFVVIGVNVIFRRKAAVRGISWLLFFALIIGYSCFAESKITIDDKNSNNKTISEKMDSEIESRKMSIKLGATEIKVDSDTEKLFEASVPESTKYFKNGSDNEIICFKKDDYIPLNFLNNPHSYKFHLNEKVDWDLEIDAGATSGTIDLSKLKIGKLDLDLGFGSMDLNFGNLSEKTEVSIDAGFSSVKAYVPKSSGVRIKVDNGIGSSNVKDFGWEKQGGYYISPNYEKAENKIDMKVDSGFSSFKMNLY